MRDQQGQLHFVVKPTRLAVARDVAVITLCAVVLAIIAADLVQGTAPAASLREFTRTLR